MKRAHIREAGNLMIHFMFRPDCVRQSLLNSQPQLTVYRQSLLRKWKKNETSNAVWIEGLLVEDSSGVNSGKDFSNKTLFSRNYVTLQADDVAQCTHSNKGWIMWKRPVRSANDRPKWDTCNCYTGARRRKVDFVKVKFCEKKKKKKIFHIHKSRCTGWRKTKKRFDLTSFLLPTPSSSWIRVHTKTNAKTFLSIYLVCAQTQDAKEKHQHEWNYWRMWANDESGGISVASRIVIDKLRRGFRWGVCIFTRPIGARETSVCGFDTSAKKIAFAGLNSRYRELCFLRSRHRTPSTNTIAQECQQFLELSSPHCFRRHFSLHVKLGRETGWKPKTTRANVLSRAVLMLRPVSVLNNS